MKTWSCFFGIFLGPWLFRILYALLLKHFVSRYKSLDHWNIHWFGQAIGKLVVWDSGYLSIRFIRESQESELPTQQTNLLLADWYASIWADSSEVFASSLCTGPSTGEALLVGGYRYLLPKVEVDEPNMFQKWWCYTLMSSYVVRLNGSWIDLILSYPHVLRHTHTCHVHRFRRNYIHPMPWWHVGTGDLDLFHHPYILVGP